MLAVGLAWWPPLLPVATTVLDVAVLVPQTRRLVTATDVTGMSRQYWAMLVAIGTGWLVYSWAVGAPLLALYQYVGVPWSAWVWWRVGRIRAGREATRP